MENKNKLIIIALIAIILAFLVGIFVSMPNFSKTDSQLEIIGNDTLAEGSNLQIKLTDANGTGLSNQTVKITFTDKDNSTSDYSVVTNDEGVGELKIDKTAGEYDINVAYDGNDGYNGCNATKKITVEKEEPTSSSSDSSSSSPRYINDEGGTYDTSTGKYVGGQHDGRTKEQVEQYNHDIVEEEKAYKREHGRN